MSKVSWNQITEFEGPEYSPGFLLWQVSSQWRRQLESALAKVNLTHAQFVLLASLGWLTRHNASVSQVALARHCKTDITMTSQVLRTLEKRGYIARNTKEENQRAKFPTLTEKGAALVEKTLPLVENIDRQFFSPLGKKIPQWVKILRQLT